MAALVLVVLWCAGAAAAAPFQHDLGERLRYHRASALPGDLPADQPGRKTPLVLDLRFARGDEAAAIATQAWLRFYASSRTPVFVLANVETSADVRRILASLRRTAGIVVIGRAGRGFDPDVPVKGSAADERKAYDALASGAPVNALVVENPDKVRNDEASLSRDRLAEASAEAAEQGKAKPPPPIDVALQRALHLHRALVALRKL